MLYARIFESNVPSENLSETGVFSSVQKIINKKQKVNALPSDQSAVDNFNISPSTTNWHDTNDLVPQSVTDHTTKLLEKDR